MCTAMVPVPSVPTIWTGFAEGSMVARSVGVGSGSSASSSVVSSGVVSSPPSVVSSWEVVGSPPPVGSSPPRFSRNTPPMIARTSAMMIRRMQPTHQKRRTMPFFGGSAPVDAVHAAPESVEGEPWP